MCRPILPDVNSYAEPFFACYTSLGHSIGFIWERHVHNFHYQLSKIEFAFSSGQTLTVDGPTTKRVEPMSRFVDGFCGQFFFMVVVGQVMGRCHSRFPIFLVSSLATRATATGKRC